MSSKALSTLAGMPVRHYQLFKFSLASEVVLPDNCIVLLLSPTHFRSCPPLPFPPCLLERVMGTAFVRRALPASVDRAVENHKNRNGGPSSKCFTLIYFGTPS